MAAPAVASAVPVSRFGSYGEGAFISTYGPMGAGKSMDLIRAFGTGLFLFPPGGLKPAVECGFALPQEDGSYLSSDSGKPRIWGVRVSTLYDIQNCITAVKGLPPMNGVGPEAGKIPPSIVIDDGSVICTNTMLRMEANGIGKTRGGNFERRLVFGELVDELKKTREMLRGLAVNVAINFHERLPSTDQEKGKGHFHQGGPDVGTQYQTDVIPYVSDLVLEARKEPARLPWPGIYICDPNDLQKGHKDRFRLAPRKGPMNVGEILRAAGYWVPRPRGLEWLDECAEAICSEIVGGGNRLSVHATWAAKLLNAGVALPYVEWGCQDGLDRAEIRISGRAERLSAMGIKVGPDGTTFVSTRT